jgi:hypothetical protein
MIGMSALSCAVALVTASGVPASSNKPLWGVKAGFFTPTSAALRDVMGNRWFSFGITRVRSEARSGTKIVADFEMIRHTSGDNKVAMVTPSATMYKDFAEPGQKNYPYVGAGLGLTYFDYRLRNGAQFDSVKRIGPSAHLIAGYVFDGKFFVSARYNIAPTYDGYGFSGLTLSAGFGFIRF